MKHHALIALMLIGSHAQAADENFYLGVGWGGTNFKSKSVDINVPSSGSIPSVIDDSDANFRLYGGYRVNPNLAFEAVISDMGEWELVDDTNGFKATYEASSVDLAVVGLLPLMGGDIDLFARGGIAIWSLDTELEATTAPGTPTFVNAPVDSGEDLFWAAGINFNNLVDNWTFRTQLISYEISEFEELAQFAFDFHYSF